MQLLHDLPEYNLWANQKIIEWVNRQDLAVLKKPSPSSYPTILKTLNHIWDAQIFYYSVLSQTPFEKDWNHTLLGLSEGLLMQSEKFAQYLFTQSVAQLQEARNIKTRTLEGTFSQAQLAIHCFNHSTYHRGQIVSIGHQVGASKAPATDYFFFCLEKQ